MESGYSMWTVGEEFYGLEKQLLDKASRLVQGRDAYELAKMLVLIDKERARSRAEQRIMLEKAPGQVKVDPDWDLPDMKSDEPFVQPIYRRVYGVLRLAKAIRFPLFGKESCNRRLLGKRSPSTPHAEVCQHKGLSPSF